MHGYFKNRRNNCNDTSFRSIYCTSIKKCHSRFSVLWMQLKCIMITGFDIMGGIAEPIFMYILHHNT